MTTEEMKARAELDALLDEYGYVCSCQELTAAEALRARINKRIDALTAEHEASARDAERARREVEGWRWAHWGHPEAFWACECGMVNGPGINQCFGDADAECGRWRPMKPAILAEVQAGATYDAALVDKHRAVFDDAARAATREEGTPR